MATLFGTSPIVSMIYFFIIFSGHVHWKNHFKSDKIVAHQFQTIIENILSFCQDIKKIL